MESNNILEYPVHALISSRKSIRAFKNSPIAEDHVHQLFEAARWSFSSGNEQAWRFNYGLKGTPAWEQLFNLLNDGNKTWCMHAPMLVLTLASKQTSRGASYRHNLHDVGAATMLMALEAVHLGMQVHPMGGFNADMAKETFAISDDLETVTMLAIGYPGEDLSALNERQQQNEKQRSSRFTQDSFILK